MAANTAIRSVSDELNYALTRIGYKKRIGSLFDGSDAAQQALDIYAQTRDEKLREFDYDFAQRTIALTLLKSAPAGGYFPPNLWDPTTMPPQGMRFEYAWPADCLKVRLIKPASLFVINADPTPNPFQISNDNYLTPPQRVILSNVPDAIASYTGQVTDPATWDVAFCDALAASLGARLGAVLGNMDGAKMAAAVEPSQTATAEMDQR